MDIRGIGESMAALLIKKNPYEGRQEPLVKDMADVYYFTKEQLTKLERMGEKSAEKLLKAIIRQQKPSAGESNLCSGNTARGRRNRRPTGAEVS